MSASDQARAGAGCAHGSGRAAPARPQTQTAAGVMPAAVKTVTWRAEPVGGCSARPSALVAPLGDHDREARADQQQADRKRPAQVEPREGKRGRFGFFGARRRARRAGRGAGRRRGRLLSTVPLLSKARCPSSGSSASWASSGSSASGCSPTSIRRPRRRRPAPRARTRAASSRREREQSAPRGCSIARPIGGAAWCPWPARGHDVGPSHANLRSGGLNGRGIPQGPPLLPSTRAELRQGIVSGSPSAGLRLPACSDIVYHRRRSRWAARRPRSALRT